MVRLTRVMQNCFVCFVSRHLVRWRRRAVCIAYSKSACKSRPPRERACLVLVQTRLLCCRQSSETRSGSLDGSCREYHKEPDHAGKQIRGDEKQTPDQGTKGHSFGDGIHPSTKAQTGRPLRDSMTSTQPIHANRRESGLQHPGGDKAKSTCLKCYRIHSKKRGAFSLANVV
jgi:hypothetical protein